jgi:hypothetical protein
VEAAIETVDHPVSVNWVSEEAKTDWRTAKSHLQRLAVEGRVHALKQGTSTVYVPDFSRAYMNEIRQLALQSSVDELRGEIIEKKAEIEALQDEYGVDSPAELQESLSDPDLTSEATQKRTQHLDRWEKIVNDLPLIQHAANIRQDLFDADPYAKVALNLSDY